MLAFHVAYYAPNQDKEMASEAELAGRSFRVAVQEALNSYVRDEIHLNVTVDIVSSTQVSIASQRHKSLTQEIGCAAGGDIIVITIMAPSSTHLDTIGNDSTERQRKFLQSLLERTASNLERTVDNERVVVRLFACKWLPMDQKILRAEQDCTQRVYHYLLPMRWLPDGLELERWIVEDDAPSSTGLEDGPNKPRNRSLSWNGQRREDGHSVRRAPPSDSIRNFKSALKRATSATIHNRRVRRKPLQQVNEIERQEVSSEIASSFRGKIATGRYGLLANKERRAWHNFADPNLRGDASPNNEPVWRVLDQVKIVSFIPGPEDNDEVAAVLEFCGDSFCREQIRRIVGTALAVAHGWLPIEIFDVATQADVWMETPLAPAGRLYMEGGRFHFDKLRTGKEFFEHGIVVSNGEDSQSWIQQHLLRKKCTKDAIHQEQQWLGTLRKLVAPRISNQLEAQRDHERHDQRSESGDIAQAMLEPPPEMYMRTLDLLRDIVASNKWPETSVARSTVIRGSVESKRAEGAEAAGGSFTVVNPAKSSYNLPLANTLFPDLVDSVFKLEEALCQTEITRTDENGSASSIPNNMRVPSSHCAVNCNAQFTVHVDSGRGQGQSLSMIVGLGDYLQGEIGVEGTYHGIRYKPLEFDGWKLRHWTKVYCGERFSLVWFTPADK
jgi:tRNA U38,U39,U40 pseudouridine synthase TruA